MKTLPKNCAVWVRTRSGFLKKIYKRKFTKNFTKENLRKKLQKEFAKNADWEIFLYNTREEWGKGKRPFLALFFYKGESRCGKH